MTTTTTLTYELRVQGHLDDHWSGWLADLDLTRQDDGSSTLVGPMADQAQLHGVLAGLRDIGATLLSLRTVDALSGSDRRPRESKRRPVLRQPVRTERLTLRAAGAEDAAASFAYRRLEPVGRWITSLPTDLETYRSTFTDPVRLADTIVVELDGETIGDLMLRVEDAWAQAEVADRAARKQAELGWVLDPARTGHGYATEAVRALLGICFEDLGLRRVVASCFLDNTASWRLMERVGMRREAHLRAESLHRSGRWLDSVTYALLAEEWRTMG
jgi:RimJ/RimL family protein N-acetyltransferase